jgi:hypothetical protein
MDPTSHFLATRRRTLKDFLITGRGLAVGRPARQLGAWQKAATISAWPMSIPVSSDGHRNSAVGAIQHHFLGSDTMKFLAGAIVVFSGCFLWASGTFAVTLTYMHSGNVGSGQLAIGGGILVVLMGFFVVYLEFLSQAIEPNSNQRTS